MKNIMKRRRRIGIGCGQQYTTLGERNLQRSLKVLKTSIRRKWGTLFDMDNWKGGIQRCSVMTILVTIYVISTAM